LKIRSLARLGRGRVSGFGRILGFEGGVLKARFPSLYSASVSSQTTLHQARSWAGKVWRWELVWRRDLFEWEKKDLNRLIHQSEGKSLIKDFKDQWV